MTLNFRNAASAIALVALAACNNTGGGEARDSIHAVGSSTVYPFAKLVSESFSRGVLTALAVVSRRSATTCAAWRGSASK